MEGQVQSEGHQPKEASHLHGCSEWAAHCVGRVTRSNDCKHPNSEADSLGYPSGSHTGGSLVIPEGRDCHPAPLHRVSEVGERIACPPPASEPRCPSPPSTPHGMDPNRDERGVVHLCC